MKITFILPAVGKKKDESYIKSWLMEPLAISTLSALTPSEIEKSFYDDRLESIPYDVPTDVVGINAETYTAKRAYEIAKEYRQRGVPVIMGGFHPTLMPEEASQHADSVLIGEGENIWEEICRDAQNKKLKPYYRAEKKSFSTTFADRNIYKDKKYTKLTLIETGRGCQFSCEFCSISCFYQKNYHARPIEDVIKEIEMISPKHVFFVDDNIAMDKNRAKKLFRKLIPLNLRWAGQVSLHIAKDEELLQLMYKSGCVAVLIGFESLNKKNLEAMGKNVNSVFDDYENAINLIRAHQIAIYGTFVFGYDQDDKSSFEETYEFSLKHKFFFAAFNHLVPFPGTPLYQRLEAENRLLYDKWWLSEDYTFGNVAFRPKLLSPQELAEYCFSYRQKFYSFPSILRRGFDFHVNCRNPFMTSLFFVQNLNSGKEARKRQGLPLGIKK